MRKRKVPTWGEGEADEDEEREEAGMVFMEGDMIVFGKKEKRLKKMIDLAKERIKYLERELGIWKGRTGKGNE